MLGQLRNVGSNKCSGASSILGSLEEKVSSRYVNIYLDRYEKVFFTIYPIVEVHLFKSMVTLIDEFFIY